MTSKPPVTVGYATQFRRDLKHLRKKYRNVQHDVEKLVERLRRGETPGEQVQGTGYTVYKTRLRSSDLTRGKSGGYRVIYYIKTPERVILVMLYIKPQQTDITPEEIRRIIDDLESSSS